MNPQVSEQNPDTRRVDTAQLAVVGRALEGRFALGARALESWLDDRAHERDLDGAYLRMLLWRPSAGWPRLRGADLAALELGSLLLRGLSNPPESSHLVMPSEAQRRVVDRCLVHAARYIRLHLAVQLRADYLAILDSLTEATSAQPSPQESGAHTLAALERFERWLRNEDTAPRRRVLARIVDALFE